MEPLLDILHRAAYDCAEAGISSEDAIATIRMAYENNEFARGKPDILALAADIIAHTAPPSS